MILIPYAHSHSHSHYTTHFWQILLLINLERRKEVAKITINYWQIRNCGYCLPWLDVLSKKKFRIRLGQIRMP